jgi:hypothetical protein
VRGVVYRRHVSPFQRFLLVRQSLGAEEDVHRTVCVLLEVPGASRPAPLAALRAQPLKVEPEGDLGAMEGHLIAKAGVAEIIIRKPVAHLGLEFTGDLATERRVFLHGDVRSDAEAAHIAFGGEVERFIQAKAPS